MHVMTMMSTMIGIHNVAFLLIMKSQTIQIAHQLTHEHNGAALTHDYNRVVDYDDMVIDMGFRLYNGAL
jgi:hypothetical protein